MRTGRLFDAESAIYSRTLPELLDVRLMAMSPQAFMLTGLERIAGTDYAQSWPCFETSLAPNGADFVWPSSGPAIQRDGSEFGATTGRSGGMRKRYRAQGVSSNINDVCVS